MLAVCPDIHCLRDATRSGLATVLSEFAVASAVCIRVREAALPINEVVHGACEILGLDPLYLANEGKLAAIVPGAAADAVLAAMRAHPAGRASAIVGEVTAAPVGSVILSTPSVVIGSSTCWPASSCRASVDEVMAVHELSITRNVVAIVSERAAGQRVTRVRLEIGRLPLSCRTPSGSALTSVRRVPCWRAPSRKLSKAGIDGPSSSKRRSLARTNKSRSAIEAGFPAVGCWR
jgi:hypothetical protein